MLKLLIFDFDGTIADTKKLWYNNIIKVLKKENIYCPECEAKVIVHFGKRIPEITKAIGLDEKIIKRITKRIFSEVLKKYRKVKPCKNLQIIRKINIKKILISNSPTLLLEKVLKSFQINKQFLEIIGGDKFDSKEKEFKKIFKKYRAKTREVAYIGDRAADVFVARKTKCLSIIVSNKTSWNSKTEILIAEPDFIIDNLGGIEKIIGN